MIPLSDEAIQIIGQVTGDLAFLMPQDVTELPANEHIPVVFSVTYSCREVAPGHPAHKGLVWIALGNGPADEAVRNLRGMSPDALVDPMDRSETAAELANIISGNLLPCLFPAAGSFDLGSPQATTAEALPRPVGVCLDLGPGVLAVTVIAG